MRRTIILGAALLAAAGLIAGCGPKGTAARGPSYYGPVRAPEPASLFGPTGPYGRPVTMLPGSGRHATGAVFLPGTAGNGVWGGWWVSAVDGTLLTQPGTAAGNGAMTVFYPPFTANGSVTWFVPGRGAPLVRGNPAELAAEVAWWRLNQPPLSTAAYGKYVNHLRGAVSPVALSILGKLRPAPGTAQLVGAWTDPTEPRTLYLQWRAFGYVKGANEAWQMSRLWTREDLERGPHGWRVSSLAPTKTPYLLPGVGWYGTFFGQPPQS